MNIKASSKILRGTCVLIIVSVLGSYQTWGAEPLGTRVWNPSQIPSRMVTAKRENMGVYGDFQFRGRDKAVIVDQTDAGKFIAVDIRRLAAADLRRLDDQCTLKACSEIVVGFMVRGTLEARSLVPFHSKNIPSILPVTFSTVAPERAAPVWRCRDSLHCT